MIKILALILLLPTLAWAGPEMLMMLTNGMGTVSSGGCSETAFLTQDTYDSGGYIGYSTTNYAVGVINESATPMSVCAIEVYVRENGALTGKTLYVERWSLTGSNLNTKLQDVTSIDATLLSGTLGYYKITFPSTVSLAQNQTLVFTMNETTGTTNYITIAFKGAASTVADQMLASYSSAGAGAVAGGVNDLRAKWYGE
jgi:hypothetical protein